MLKQGVLLMLVCGVSASQANYIDVTFDINIVGRYVRGTDPMYSLVDASSAMSFQQTLRFTEYSAVDSDLSQEDSPFLPSLPDFNIEQIGASVLAQSVNSEFSSSFVKGSGDLHTMFDDSLSLHLGLSDWPASTDYFQQLNISSFSPLDGFNDLGSVEVDLTTGAQPPLPSSTLQDFANDFSQMGEEGIELHYEYVFGPLNQDTTYCPDEVPCSFSSDEAQYYMGTATIASVSSVPVPAAFWLFGSAVMGLVGLKRR
ncbi:VPLPA-CTERM sorting domain-containing protein [bacterium]|nr:VPLPA-CTERM sorting domain-containing protein [bacterium]